MHLNMKKFFIPFVTLAFVLLMNSCMGSKEVPYFQNIDHISLADSRGLYDAKIMPKDMLTITVNTVNQEAARPFNLTVSRSLNNSGEISTGGGMLQGYLVDNDGYINFPVVGKIHVLGLTKRECEDRILSKIMPYMNEAEKPIVTVRMSSYRVTVIGEIGSRVIPVSTEKMSIIEAIASAGDLGLQGRRDNVLLIREDESGQKSIHRFNLNDGNVLNDPYYYLQQNDIIYVQPNRVKAKSAGIGASTNMWFTFVGIVTSVASLLVNVLKD